MADEVNMNNSITQENPWPYTVDPATAIEKGAWGSLADPMTAATNIADGGIVVGIAARELVADTGKTQLAFHKRGKFEVTCSGTVVLGLPLSVYNNKVQTAAVTASGAALVGYPEETGSDGEKIIAFIDVGLGGTASG